MSELVVLSETPDAETVATTIELLRRSGALGDTYADFQILLRDVADEDAAYDRLANVGRFIAASFDASRWWVADWLLFGEGVLGDRFYQLVEILGLAEATVLDYLRVGMKVARSRRRRELHFSHHRIVAKLDPEAQTYWLDRAVEDELSTRELADAITAAADSGEAGSGGGGQPDPVVETIRVERPLLASLVNHARASDDPEWVLIPADLIPRVRALLGEEER